MRALSARDRRAERPAGARVPDRARSGGSCRRRSARARAPALEAALARGHRARADRQARKSAWFNAFRDVVLTRDGVAWLERVWRRDEQIPGLPFAETDEIAMAMELAVREVPGWERDPADAARSDAEPGSQGALRVRDAGAVGRSRGSRARRSQRFRLAREPPPRAVGRSSRWSISIIRCARRHVGAVRCARRSTCCARFSGPATSSFPTRWMEATLWGHRSPRRGGDRARLSRETAAVPAAAAMDDSQLGRRTAQSRSTIGPVRRFHQPPNSFLVVRPAQQPHQLQRDREQDRRVLF